MFLTVAFLLSPGGFLHFFQCGLGRRHDCVYDIGNRREEGH